MSISSTVIGLMSRHKKSIRFLLCFTVALVLSGAIALLCMNPAARGTLLLITPMSAAEQGTVYDVIEDINDELFPITYVCEERAVAYAVNTSETVTLCLTNYSYPHVIQRMIISGGFFTKAHQHQAARVAVMNEQAAFALFGDVNVSGNTLTIRDEIYRVVGVIGDGRETPHIYLPVTTSADAQPNAFAVRLDEALSEARVKNVLKQVGVTESAYDFQRVSEGWLDRSWLDTY